MRGLRFNILLLGTLIFGLLSSTVVQACSFAPATIYIRCGEARANLISERDFYSAKPEQEHQVIETAFVNLQTTNPDCLKLIPSLRKVFPQQYADWKAKPDYITLEPYSPEREAELQESQNQLTECWYKHYSRDGDWLIITNETRDYCVSGYCLQYSFSISRFLLYAIANPNWQTLPFLLGYMLLTVVGVGSSLIFLNRPLPAHHKIIVIILCAAIAFIVTLAQDVFLFSGNTIFPEMILWIGACFGIAIVLHIATKTYRQLLQLTHRN